MKQGPHFILIYTPGFDRNNSVKSNRTNSFLFLLYFPKTYITRLGRIASRIWRNLTTLKQNIRCSSTKDYNTSQTIKFYVPTILTVAMGLRTNYQSIC